MIHRPHGTTARAPDLVPPALGAWDRHNPAPGAPGRHPYHRPLSTGPRLRLILPPRQVCQGICGQTLRHCGRQARPCLPAVGLLGSGSPLAPHASRRAKVSGPLRETTRAGYSVHRAGSAAGLCGLREVKTHNGVRYADVSPACIRSGAGEPTVSRDALGMSLETVLGHAGRMASRTPTST